MHIVADETHEALVARVTVTIAPVDKPEAVCSACYFAGSFDNRETGIISVDDELTLGIRHRIGVGKAASPAAKDKKYRYRVVDVKTGTDGIATTIFLAPATQSCEGKIRLTRVTDQTEIQQGAPR